MQNKLRRKMNDRVLAGVCSGIAKFYDLDPRNIRIAFLLGILFGTITIWVYLVLALIIPSDMEY